MKFNLCARLQLALMMLTWAGLSARSGAKAISGRRPCVQIGPSIGLIVGSRERMRCCFVSASDHGIDRYRGTITRFGLTVGGVMRWSV